MIHTKQVEPTPNMKLAEISTLINNIKTFYKQKNEKKEFGL